MSNYLAIATSTAALGQIIGQAMQAVPKLSAAPVVKMGRPERAESGFVGAGLYLFKVGPNASLRNEDLASRLGDGTLVKRPQVALDLDYLLTFHGDDSQLEPQRLLGSTVSALHAEPVLSRERIRQTIATAGPGSYLADSDLDEQVEHVTLSAMSLSLEDLSKMWSTFFQIPYALSVCYSASVVLIDAVLTPVEIPPTKQAAIDAGVSS